LRYPKEAGLSKSALQKLCKKTPRRKEAENLRQCQTGRLPERLRQDNGLLYPKPTRTEGNGERREDAVRSRITQIKSAPSREVAWVKC